MSNTLRWSLALVVTGLIGLALLLAGVALGRATGGVTEYEPADITPRTFSPVDIGSSPGTMGSGMMNGNSAPGMIAPGAVDGNVAPGMMGPDTTLAPARSADMAGNSVQGMMGDNTTSPGFGPGTMGPGMMGGNSPGGMMRR